MMQQHPRGRLERPISRWPLAVRRPLARLLPYKPWIWERPARYAAARLALLCLDRLWPAGLERDWTVPFFGGARFLCDLREIKDRVILMHGFSEYRLAHLLSTIVREDWICADVGANSGEYTVLLAQLAPRGHVYAFEPAPHVLPRLEANVRLNRLTNVTVEAAAVSEFDGKTTLYVDRSRHNSGLSSLSPQPWRSDTELEEREVPSTSLDRYLPGGRLDLMKIDVEGHELEVLRGAVRLLTDARPIVVFEFGGVGQLPPPDVPDFLRSLGYVMHCVSYDVARGPGLARCEPPDDRTLSLHYTPREPANIVAVPPDREARYAASATRR